MYMTQNRKNFHPTYNVFEGRINAMQVNISLNRFLTQTNITSELRFDLLYKRLRRGVGNVII